MYTTLSLYLSFRNVQKYLTTHSAGIFVALRRRRVALCTRITQRYVIQEFVVLRIESGGRHVMTQRLIPQILQPHPPVAGER